MWRSLLEFPLEAIRRRRSRQAVVLLTHVESPRMLEHYRRLQRETENLLDCFLCVHEPEPREPAERIMPADIRVQRVHAERYARRRYREMLKAKRSFTGGFADLVYMPALLGPSFRFHQYVWILENDMDYAGNWADFFRSAMQSRADFLSTKVIPRRDSENWHHWRRFRPPADVPADHHIRCFAPIARFSHRMLHRYRAAIRTGRWRGHHEALYPTVARHHGLTVEDLGPAHYSPASMVFRPPVASAYFEEQPEAFTERNLLYHPVKLSQP